MKRKPREYKPVGVMARITLKLWMPGITDLDEGMKTARRVLKVQTQAGDYVVLVGGGEQEYTVIEEPRRQKLNLPLRPESNPCPHLCVDMNDNCMNCGTKRVR